MKLKQIMLGGLGLSVLASPVFADGTDFPFAVHDIIISNHTQMVNITVANVSNSTDPADRELRMVSADPVVSINGQVWCNTYQFAETAALRADIRLGAVNIVSAPGGGTQPFMMSANPMATEAFSGTHNLENYAFQQSIDLPDSYDADALVNMDYFNPVSIVEARLANFLENNAGTEADFLRQDDVFEAEFDVSIVGWCSYESDILDNDYAGARWVTIDAHIFYQGDDDIQDVVQTVSSVGSVTAPVPSRARGVATTRGSSATPPARNTRPARARVDTVNDDRASDDDNEAALLLPAVQRVREAARHSRSGNEKATGLDKQQVGRGRARSRATVTSSGAAASAPGNDGLDTDSDGVRTSVQHPYRLDVNNGEEPQAGLLLPAVQAARASAGNGQANESAAGVEPDVIGTGASAPQPTPRDPLLVINEATADPEPQATPVDALMIINRNADDGVEPDEID
ncbi:hypothetical protein V0U79_08390 [Hyphobacterium sp. HN65]|uniref:DUF4424 domain-containing protein n=1 Tax=Hyphobacterium lacteum TaxID=3116575 RepID=A0ABU7LR44_9PROT|nr:hypothetical protein [Hyphobacterium sp. HN65]MEE2526382.1 hypothetical protein [Hyphobacterium sp. HN65]